MSGCQQDVCVNIYPKVEIWCSSAYDHLPKDNKACTFQLTDTDLHVVSDDHALIKLRGNSTSEWPKRPFSIQLSKECSLCGMPEAKKWVLLANWFDKTMLRNSLAFMMGEKSALDWTPHFQFIELYYNGAYKGTYQLCEKIEVHPNRVEIAPEGWLIEIDANMTEKGTYFRTTHMENPYRIAYPDKNLTQQQTEQIHTSFIQAEEVLFGENFSDTVNGWRKYLDEESWIDWYLINEIAKNGDGNFYRSCYMHSSSDGKIALGPLWDYDTCFGNSIWEDPCNPVGIYVGRTEWFVRLMQDTLFAQKVRERFAFFYNQQDQYYNYIYQTAKILQPSIKKNDGVWHTIGTQISPYLSPNSSYDEDVNTLVSWLKVRFEWLLVEL